ncbi:MAG: TonB-dependent receptor family protein, partial [Bacteroidales bacterium]|nr:TonB-dependent receptor family protein [Bacteroidales bacterium]
MKRILLALSLLATIVSYSQSYRLSGIVTETSDQKPLPGSTVILTVEGEDYSGQGTVTDSDGNFHFLVKTGIYNLQISFVGYKTYKKEVEITETDIDLGNISLEEEVTQLDEFQITEQTPQATQIGDTTQFNAESFKVNPDADAENLIEKMPGVIIQDGKVQVQGEDVQQVLVDGKRFFGDDPNTALKTIPAEIIDKIQVFDQQSEQAKFTGFDDGETTKTINIVTKLEYRNGKFGNVYAGAGTDDRYMAGGSLNIFDNDRKISLLGQSNNINKQNFSSEDLLGVMSSSGRRGRGFRPGGGGPPPGGRSGGRPPGRGGSGGDVNDFKVNQQGGITQTHATGINYTDKWGENIDVTGSYFFNYGDNLSESFLTREYVAVSETKQLYDENDVTDSRNINHRANLRFDYKINENNSILFRPKFTFQDNNGLSLTDAATRLDNQLLNISTNNFKSDLNAWNFTNDLLYRHKFGKKGRTLSVRLRQDLNDNKGNSFQFSQYSSFDTFIYDTVDQSAELDKYERSFTGNLMYTEPLGDNKQLQINYRGSYSNNKSDKETWNFSETTNDYTQLDTILTNKFKNTYTTNEAGTGIRYNKGKMQIMVRASYQISDLRNNRLFPEEESLDRQFNSILPMAMMRYRFSRSKNLRIMYRTNTSAPSIDDLQDVADNSNPLQITIGNPALDQQTQHNMFMRYSAVNTEKNTVFFAMIRGAYTDNYIGNQTLTAKRDTVLDNGIQWLAGSQLIQPVNLDGYFNVRSFITYGIPVEVLKSNFNFNLSAGYTRTPGLIGRETNYAHNPSWGLGLVLSSNISEKLDFTLSTNSQYGYVTNTLNTGQNSHYLNNLGKFKIYWNFWKNLVYRTDLNHQYYTGLSEGYNENFWLWNMSFGWKFLKNKEAEVTLAV